MCGKYGFLDDSPLMKRALFISIILLTVFELFLGLGGGVLYWDEAIYAQVSKEMIETGAWLTPHWNGHHWFQKPPAYFWVTALLFRLFAASEFWARAASALSGVGVVAVSYLIARLIYNQAAGVLAALILLSSELFVFYARFGTTDTMLTFVVLLAVYGYLRAEDDDRWWLLAGTGCGLALMVKGAAGLIAPATLGLAVLLDGKTRSAFRSKWLWVGIACAVLIVIPWHALMYRLHGDSFVNGYLFQNVLDRAKGNLNEYQRGYGYYLRVLWDFFSPWVYVLPFALIFGRAVRSKVLLILAVLVMCLYTAVQTKFQWYIGPAIPAFSIIIGGFIARSIENRPRAQQKLAIVALALLWFAGTAAVFSRVSRREPEMEAGARLARLASSDKGGIVAYPENLEMTVRYYSGRKLCTDPVLSTLSHSELTECIQGEATNIIFRKADLARVSTRFKLQPLAQHEMLMYARITPKDAVSFLPKPSSDKVSTHMR
jgi:4-amino-4-deoxy-L-arabinose transferase-like glycosyltransferase